MNEQNMGGSTDPRYSRMNLEDIMLERKEWRMSISWVQDL
jgi:hypothetical protein